jgi:hypothetical protein
MKTCATEKTITGPTVTGNLFLPLPDTDFRTFLDEVDELARFAPSIITAIESDLDMHAREKKRLRLADRKYFESQMADIPCIDIEEREIQIGDLSLASGRPRMPAKAVYMFLMMRGFLGSLSTQQSVRFLHESISVYAWLLNGGLQMPGVSTILDNVNAVSHTTRELIFSRQIARIFDDQLDDFQHQTIDSTSVKANSCWPTDSKILTGLLTRAERLGQMLDTFGLKNFKKGWVPRWLEEMDKLVFQIALTAGKPNAKTKFHQQYRQLLTRGKKVLAALEKEFGSLEQDLQIEAFAPSQRIMIGRVVEQLRRDLSDARRVSQYTHDRVFEQKNLPSKEKVLSLSDGSASFIQKGSREPVIGYKPQLVRSANGFVASLLVPEGNAADAAMLVESIIDAFSRTGVIAGVVSTDDGYASAKGRDMLLAMGVKTISISGAKGKKLTTPEDWESETYQEARRYRSAVESLMFTIKDGFAFGQLGRRGIEAVRDELLEKVLAYNCCRTILMRQRRQDALEQAA